MRLSNRQIDAVVNVLGERQEKKRTEHRAQRKKEFLKDTHVQSEIANIVKDTKSIAKRIRKIFGNSNLFDSYGNDILLNEKRLAEYLFNEQYKGLPPADKYDLRDAVVLAAMNSNDLAELSRRLGVRL